MTRAYCYVDAALEIVPSAWTPDNDQKPRYQENRIRRTINTTADGPTTIRKRAWMVCMYGKMNE